MNKRMQEEQQHHPDDHRTGFDEQDLIGDDILLLQLGDVDDSLLGEGLDLVLEASDVLHQLLLHDDFLVADWLQPIRSTPPQFDFFRGGGLLIPIGERVAAIPFEEEQRRDQRDDHTGGHVSCEGGEVGKFRSPDARRTDDQNIRRIPDTCCRTSDI